MRIALANHLTPHNWRLRVDVAKKMEDLCEREIKLKKELDKNPLNFLAIRYWGNSELEAGNLEAGCETLALYNLFFNGKSMVSETLSKTCSVKEMPNKKEFLVKYASWAQKRNFLIPRVYQNSIDYHH